MPSQAISIGFRTLAANPLRTALSTLGVVMGTGALVAVLSVGDGVERFERQQIAETTDLQFITLIPRTTVVVDGVALPRGDTVQFQPRDAADLAGVLGPGALFALRREGAATVTGLPGDSLRGTRVIAQEAGPPRMDRLQLVAGRWFTSEEAEAGASVAVLSAALADRVAGDSTHPERAVGSHVVLEGAPVEVVGVVTPQPDDGFVTRVPYAAFPRVVSARWAGQPAELLVRGDSIERMPAMLATTESWVESRWPDGKNRVVIQSRGNRLAQMQQAVLIFKLLMGTITGISLLVGGIGIMNVMLASVLERTREIGVRRATGARQRDVLTQFLSESVTITGVGAGLGTMFGLAVAFAATAFMRTRTGAPVHAAISATTLLVAAGSAIVVGLGFGLYPALRAARLSPIEAIRHE